MGVSEVLSQCRLHHSVTLLEEDGTYSSAEYLGILILISKRCSQ